MMGPGHEHLGHTTSHPIVPTREMGGIRTNIRKNPISYDVESLSTWKRQGLLDWLEIQGIPFLDPVSERRTMVPS